MCSTLIDGSFGTKNHVTVVVLYPMLLSLLIRPVNGLGPGFEIDFVRWAGPGLVWWHIYRVE